MVDEPPGKLPWLDSPLFVVILSGPFLLVEVVADLVPVEVPSATGPLFPGDGVPVAVFPPEFGIDFPTEKLVGLMLMVREPTVKTSDLLDC